MPPITATGLLNYDANDRTATDPYDSNGNLLNGGVGSNIYDFENHMVAAGGVSTVAGVTTSYLVADQNLTGCSICETLTHHSCSPVKIMSSSFNPSGNSWSWTAS
ncbi:MAG TPA: hypothetical protein VGN44_16990 [Candidatus Angelobacter sp.]